MNTKKSSPLVVQPFCAIKPVTPKVFEPGITADRARAINSLSNKWVNGTELTYCFFNSPEEQRAIVRQAFDTWKSIGIGVKFTEVDNIDHAMLRIGFTQGDGSWSYVGRAVLQVAADQRTMNFGWDLTDNLDTAIHEIGHSLGFQHEHQNPFAGIVWDEELVYKTLAAAPNYWSREVTQHNILDKLDPASVQGTEWDPNSVMHYPFPAGLILEPVIYRTQALVPAGGLSERDKAQAHAIYPPQDPIETYPELKLMQSMPLNLKPAQQLDLRLLSQRSRSYQIRTLGEADTVIVLYEEVDGRLRYRGGDDDSGEGRNAYLKLRMSRGGKYVLRIRLYYADHYGETAVLWW